MRILILSFFAVSILSATTVVAKPKGLGIGGSCTQSQLDLPQNAACFQKQDQDRAQGSATIHSIYCSSTGAVLCCEYNELTGAIVDHSCQAVRQGVPAQQQNRPPPVKSN